MGQTVVSPITSELGSTIGSQAPPKPRHWVPELGAYATIVNLVGNFCY